MKRIFCVFVMCSMILSFFGCVKEKAPIEDAETELRTFITPDNYKLFYEYTPAYFDYGAETTHYLEDKDTIEEYGLETSDKKIDCEVTGTGSLQTFKIDGVLYYPLESHMIDNFLESYTWSVDRFFFYKYADTEQGAVLYRNINCKTDEVVIYSGKIPKCEAEEIILVKHDSPLRDSSGIMISDFGIAVVNYHTFTRAAIYEDLLLAHTTSEEVRKTDYDELRGKKDMWQVDIDMEYTRIPGLRYFFAAGVSMNENEQEIYVYSRKKNCIVCAPGTANVPHEIELFRLDDE